MIRVGSMLLVGLCVALAGCDTPQSDTLPGTGGDGDTATGGDGDGGAPTDPDGERPEPPAPEACTKMDILFVVDDSTSMEEEQDNLAANFPLFSRVINEYMTASGDTLDYRIGVTTTGKTIISIDPIFGIPVTQSGSDGKLQTGSGCGMVRPWLERTDGDVVGSFSCVARVGVSGPGMEMPLWNIEQAFSEPNTSGQNAGFLREDALLALVILTDEDDCSQAGDEFEGLDIDLCTENDTELIEVDHYVGFLDGLKKDRGRWAAAVIAGPGPGRCRSSNGEAQEAVRLAEFVEQTGTNAVFSSICEADLSGALEDALETFEAACEAFPRPE